MNSQTNEKSLILNHTSLSYDKVNLSSSIRKKHSFQFDSIRIMKSTDYKLVTKTAD